MYMMYILYMYKYNVQSTIKLCIACVRYIHMDRVEPLATLPPTPSEGTVWYECA